MNHIIEHITKYQDMQTISMMAVQLNLPEENVRLYARKIGITPLTSIELHEAQVLAHYEDMTEKQLQISLRLSQRTVRRALIKYGRHALPEAFKRKQQFREEKPIPVRLQRYISAIQKQRTRFQDRYTQIGSPFGIAHQ